MEIDAEYSFQEPEQHQSLQQETEGAAADLQENVLHDVAADQGPEAFEFSDVWEEKAWEEPEGYWNDANCDS